MKKIAFSFLCNWSVGIEFNKALFAEEDKIKKKNFSKYFNLAFNTNLLIHY